MKASPTIRAAVHLATILVPAFASAQVPDSIALGTRVRVHWHQSPIPDARGELVARDSATLTVRVPNWWAGAPPDSQTRLVVIPQRAITRFEVSAGRHSNAGKGALVGGIAGAGLGLILGVAAANESCTGYCIEYSTGDVVAITAILGLSGAGVGALIGALSHGERWTPVPLGAAVSLRPLVRPGVPGNGALDVGVVLRF